jgi:hypothetical protein
MGRYYNGKGPFRQDKNFGENGRNAQKKLDETRRIVDTTKDPIASVKRFWWCGCTITAIGRLRQQKVRWMRAIVSGD